MIHRVINTSESLRNKKQSANPLFTEEVNNAPSTLDEDGVAEEQHATDDTNSIV